MSTAVIGLGAAAVLNILANILLPLPTPDSPAGDFAMKLTGPAFFIFAVGAIVIAPICEELLCRGFLFNMLRGSLRRRLESKWALRVADFGAVLLSGAFFAGMHGTLTGFPGLFITGCVLAVVYQRRNSLFASIFMHSMNNILATIALYAAIHH
jgi:membrane protease YdiL (CAAX protease family)